MSKKPVAPKSGRILTTTELKEAGLWPEDIGICVRNYERFLSGVIFYDARPFKGDDFYFVSSAFMGYVLRKDFVKFDD